MQLKSSPSPAPAPLLQYCGSTAVNLPRQMSHLDPDAPRPSTLTLISLSTLPNPKQWDCDLIERIKALSALDMALLYKSFLQSASILLPQINLFGQGSAPFDKLREMATHYLSCSRGFRDINPLAWSERHHYDMETHGSVDTSRVISEDL